MDVVQFVFFYFLVTSHWISANKDAIYTEKEQLALEKARRLVKDIKYDNWIKQDWSLIHYLRVKNLDVSAAVAAVKETVKWREENKIDSILSESIIELKPPFNSKLTAKDGSPLMIWLPARWDVRKQLLNGKRPQMVRYFDQMCEATHVRIRDAQNGGKNVTQWIQILDLFNYNLRTHACITCFPLYFEWVTHWEKHYPDAHQQFFYVNTPRIFEPLLELLKPLYSVPTRKAIVVHGVDKGEWQPELLKIIEFKELPKVLGGTLAWP